MRYYYNLLKSKMIQEAEKHRRKIIHENNQLLFQQENEDFQNFVSKKGIWKDKAD